MLVVAPEVQNAIDTARPVVALETTLIAHGIPKPRNLQLAHDLQAAVRSAGAIPATIGLIDGHVRIGMSDAELSSIASAEHVVKCTTRDLARVLAQREMGATTIASTIFLARRAGIRFMATGGLGGVHPNGENSLDISADLVELARSPVAIFCSGPKIILDLPRTMEFLETQGITVLGYGCNKLPGFYVQATELEIPAISSIERLVQVIQAQSGLGWPASIVIANPPPGDLAFPPDEFKAYLKTAQIRAVEAGISGNALTPFLLSDIAKATDQRSVTLNEALVLRNAELAAQTALKAAAGASTD